MSRREMSSKTKKDALVRIFCVDDPQKHPKGFTVYKVTSKSYPVESPHSVTEVVVWRRYSDFKRLHQQLHTLHKALHRRAEFPPFAKPKVFGRFEDCVIEERRKSACDLLTFAATQPHLLMCQDFHNFFEGGTKVKKNEISALGNDNVLKPVDLNPVLKESTDGGNDNEDGRAGSPEGDVFRDSLGGVWKYRKPGDNISLNEDDDELTDDSALSTPLPDTDISFFDPLNEAPENSEGDSLQCSNTWLLSAMKEIESPVVTRKNEDTDIVGLELPSPPMVSPGQDIDVIDGREICVGKGSDSTLSLSEFDPLKPDNQEHTKAQVYSVNTQGNMRDLATDANKTNFSEVLNSIASRERSKTAESVTGMDLGNSDDYIFQAANQISLAKECEATGNYEVAFGYYKSGVGFLLKGVQNDTNKSRRDAVRRKTAQYLLKAEDIYNRHIASKSEDSKRWGLDSKISPSTEVDTSIAYMQGPVSELRNYKVLGVIDRVMLVLDKMTEDTFIIKILHKSGSDTECHDKSIIPASCPYMVRFFRFYETDFAIYVLLQHASGGKLWNYLHSYLNQTEANRDRSESKVSKVSTDSQVNVYSGQHLMDDFHNSGNVDSHGEPTVDSVATDALTPKTKSPDVEIKKVKDCGISPESTSECSYSYVQLFTDYESNVGDLTEFGAAHFHKPNSDGSGDGKSHNVHDHQGDDGGTDLDTTLRSGNEGNGDSFHAVLSNSSQPPPELFSIISYDSDTERKDSTLSESDTLAAIDRIPGIPEETSDSAFQENGVPHVVGQYDNAGQSEINATSSLSEASDLISSAKELLKSVDEALAECDSDEITSSQSQKPSLQSQSVDEHGHFSADISIYDINRSYNSDHSIDANITTQSEKHELLEDSSLKRDEKLESDFTSVVPDFPRPLCRQLSQNMSLDRSFDSPRTYKNRGHLFSTVFSDLDAMASKVSSFKLPEACVCQWVAEIIVAVSHLHYLGIICCDLRPDNILLGDRGHILLTFFSQWRCVSRSLDSQAIDLLYVAPELKRPIQPSPICDWWSVGVLLYELLTCQTLVSAHPAGITTHTQLLIPDHVSEEARSLLSQLLVVNPQERLGAGLNGAEEIKSHPFFSKIDWNKLS